MDLTRDLLKRGPFDYIDLEAAKWRWATFRMFNGLSRVAVPLLTAPDGNSKFAKTEAAVYGLALAPANVSGNNVCRFSTEKCRDGCVSYAGHGELPTVQKARVVRTKFLAADPAAFITLLMHEIDKAWRKHGIQLRVRLNTFSDLPWERIVPELFERFPLVRFYDYTKWHDRTEVPNNYHLTYSVSERTADSSVWMTASTGVNQAVVFRLTKSQPLPTTWQGVRVIDGDKSDDRFNDPEGVIVGLRAKGRMRSSDYDGFVREAVFA